MINRFRRKLLDRVVLRPSRDHLDHAPQHRHVFRSKHGNLEYFTQHQSAANGCDGTSVYDQANDAGAAKSEWLVLKFPGTSGRAERSSMFPLGLLPNACGQVWTLNPPGYGNSEGRARLSTLVDVAAEFVAFALASRFNPRQRVLLCGNSLGSATVLGVAARICQRELVCQDERMRESPPIGLLLRNVPPIAEVVQRVAARYPLGHLMNRVAATTPGEMDAIQSASKVTFPAVFLQSERDTLVPPELQQRVFGKFAGSKCNITLGDLGHDSPLTPTHLAEIATALEWLADAIADVARPKEKSFSLREGI